MLDLPTFSQLPPTMAVTCAFFRESKSHTSVLHLTIDPLWGQARPFRSRGPRCSASVILDSRALQLRLDLETSLLSFLCRMPNQVARKHRLRMNQRLFCVQVLILGGLNWRLRGWFQCGRRYRGGWLICLGCAPDQDPLRQGTACAVPCV